MEGLLEKALQGDFSFEFHIYKCIAIFNCKGLLDTYNFYEKLEKEMGDLVKCAITFWVFHGIKFFGWWVKNFHGK